MKKLFAISLLFSLLLSLCGCQVLNYLKSDNEQDKPGPGGDRPANSHYTAFLALDNYEDVMYAVQVGKENGFDYDFKYYTITGLSEDYQPIYSFTYYNVWTVYPISIDDYIKNAVAMPTLVTDIYYTGNDYCDKHEEKPMHEYYLPSSEIEEYTKYPCVKMILPAFYEKSFVDIEDTGLLSAELSVTPTQSADYYEYKCFYDGRYIFDLHSCFELAEYEISYLLSHMVSIN